MLRTHGFDPILTSNGSEALETYRERHAEIGLVLCDVKMPIMSGIEMTRKLLEIHSYARILLMSGADLSEAIPEDIGKRCSVIGKPFTCESLLAAVKEHMPIG